MFQLLLLDIAIPQISTFEQSMYFDGFDDRVPHSNSSCKLKVPLLNAIYELVC